MEVRPPPLGTTSATLWFGLRSRFARGLPICSMRPPFITTTRSANVMAALSRSSRPGVGRPSRDGRHLASRMPTARSLDGTARDAADESIKEKIIGDGHRHTGDQRRAHQFAPVEDIAADEVGRDPQSDGLFL